MATQLAANLTMLFGEMEFLDRFEAAAQAGFRGVEFLFPYAYEARELQRRLRDHSLAMVLHNLPAGDWAAGERGIGCLPDRVDEFKQGDEVRIEFSLRGREWRSPQGELKYFNSLDVWKLESARGNRRASGSGPASQSPSFRGDPRDMDIPPRGDDDFRPRGGADDDLPF